VFSEANYGYQFYDKLFALTKWSEYIMWINFTYSIIEIWNKHLCGAYVCVFVCAFLSYKT